MCNSQIGNEVKFCPNCGATEFVEVQPNYPYSEETTVLESQPQQNGYSQPNINQTYNQSNFQQPYRTVNTQMPYGSPTKKKIKAWQILLIVLGAVLILGVGAFFLISSLSYETRTFVKESNDVVYETEITAKGDKIIKWQDSITLDKDDSYYDIYVKNIEESLDGVDIYDFIDVDIDEDDDKYVATVTINELDNKNKLEKAIDENLISVSGTDDPDYLSMTLTVKNLRTSGYTEED